MSRKIYYKNSRRREKIQKQAFEAMREARESIDPALLEKAREAVGEAMHNARQQQNRPDSRGEVPVNRRKNMRVLTKFLEMHADNPALLSKFEKLISDHRS